MKQLRTLAAIFSPHYRCSEAGGAVLLPGGRLGTVVEVAARSACAYRQFDFSHLRPRQRAGAAQLASARQEPVAGSPAHVSWTGGLAHVWWWLDAPAGVPRSGGSWIPETLLRAAPADGDGVRLVRMLRGFEGQHWSGGLLRGSQWWPDTPTPDQWSRFMRACAIPAIAAPPPVGVDASRPWGTRPRRGGMAPDRIERNAWRATALLLAASLGWHVAGLAAWSQADARLESELDRARATSAPLLGARERAEGARVEIERLTALQEGVDDQELMVDIARRLPKEDSIGAWQREGRRLQFSIRSSATDPRPYVEALEGLSGIVDLQASPEAGGMRIELTLAGGPDEPGSGAEGS